MLKTLLNNYNIAKYDIVNSKTNPEKENILNQFNIYVINLRSDKTRRSYIKHLFKKHRINYSLIVVDKFSYKSNEDKIKYRLKENVLGCALSHLWCIRHAVFSNFNKFIIFEDDIMFHKNFQRLFEEIIFKHFELDLLMMGALDTNVNNVKSDLVYYPKHSVLGAHANMYKLDFAKDFLNYKLTTENVKEFDYDYNFFTNKYKIAVCIPNLVVCELSTTNLDHNFSPLKNYCCELSKKWFPDNFTYNDYEYIIIVFIDYIKTQIDDGKCFNNLEEMVEHFKMNYNKAKSTLNVCKYILNGGYKKEDVLEIIMLM